MRKEVYMVKTSEELVDVVIDALLDYKGFENWWYDLNEDDQDEIKEDLAEVIQGSSDDNE